MKEALRRILESQEFYDFYVDGALAIQIRGDFERGSKKCKENDKKVEDYLDKMVAKLKK